MCTSYIIIFHIISHIMYKPYNRSFHIIIIIILLYLKLITLQHHHDTSYCSTQMCVHPNVHQLFILNITYYTATLQRRAYINHHQSLAVLIIYSYTLISHISYIYILHSLPLR